MKYKELIVKQTGKQSDWNDSGFGEFKIYNKSNKLLGSNVDLIRINGKISIDYTEVGKIRIFGIVNYTIDCGILALIGEK
jgi:hypothetical protein